MSEVWTTTPSPVGEVLLVGSEAGLTKLHFWPFTPPVTARTPEVPLLRAAVAQLAEYFAGERTAFDLPLTPPGTAFQRRVWDELARIPYGTTTTYGAVALRLGDPKSVRAVGLANGRNPIGIVVPCHRVVGADGKLRGYAGGIERKQQLLALESAALF